MDSFKNKMTQQNKEGIISYSNLEEAERKNPRLSFELGKIIKTSSNEIVFLCIGSDRSTGDAFGPLVGTLLKEDHIPYPVYGTLSDPVHALNLESVLKEIQKKFKNPLIIGIDACLGDYHQIGSIFLKEGSFSPGNAVHNVLPHIGDYHLTAVVNYLDPHFPVHSLNGTRLNTVMALAKYTTKLIARADE